VDTTMLPSATPIFTDDSGRRATVVQWLARGVCGTSVVVAGAVVLTLTTHVPLPGLDRILSPHRGAEAGLTIRADTADGGAELGSQLDLAQEVAFAAGRRPVTVRSARAGTQPSVELVAVGRRAPETPAVAATPTDTGTSTPGAEPPATGGAGSSNPHAAAKGANSGNPRAAAGSSNSSSGATGPDRTATGQDIAAQAKAKPKTQAKTKAPDQARDKADATPPGAMKK
jgi:hypothetical protein